MVKVDLEKVKYLFGEYDRPAQLRRIQTLQVGVYVMCGGGFLGRFAAEQPADFYIDDRVGRLPYKKKEICQAVSILSTISEKFGMNPHNLSQMSDLLGCGIF